VTLKTGVMMLKFQLYQHKIFKNNYILKYIHIENSILKTVIFHNIAVLLYCTVYYCIT